jgi:hypothetical protein
MKLILSIILVAIPWLSFAQNVNFQDDFNDRNISNWSGDISDFNFINESGNIFLQQNAAEAGSSQLAISSSNTVGFWEFFIRFDGFNPSGGNKAEFYLMSDSANFESALNGYMLQAGEDGSNDVLRLFKITEGIKDGEILSGTTSISSGGDFRVKVIRDTLGVWNLEVSTSYISPTITEATGTDNTYTSTSYFGFKTTYTSTRTDKFVFDFKIDIPPIRVTNAVLKDDKRISIEFNRNYDPSSLGNSDFTLAPSSQSPINTIRTSGNSLEIEFNNSLESGPIELTISGIDDEVNETSLVDTTISLFRYDDFQSGDIVINEFLKDPPGILGEYVELKNTSSRYLNLKNWMLGDNSFLSTISNEDFVLLPDSFVVITSDSAALYSVFGNCSVLEVSLPAFNNSTDQIRLFNDMGILIDSLEYTPSWGGVDVALERRDVTAPSIFSENWGDSPNALAGTAGAENEVAPDVTPPKPLIISVPNELTIVIDFNETLESGSATNNSNFLLSPIIPVSVIDHDLDRITLTLSSALLSGIDYQVSIINQKDIFGNVLADTTFDLRYLEFSTPKRSDIIINEVLYKRADENSPEFIELYNRSSNNFDLSNWKISDAAGNTAILPEGITLEPDKYLVLTDRINFAESMINGIYLPGFPSLNNNGDGIIIRSDTGLTIDSLFYTEHFGGYEDGISTEKIDPNAAANDVTNWESNTHKKGHSGGSENSNFQLDTFKPKPIFAKLQANGTLIVAFSEFIDPSGTSFIINGDQKFITDFDQHSANIVALDGSDLDSFTSFELNILNLNDVVGNSLSSGSIQISQPINPGSVVINEILFDPLSNDEDNLPDQTEYIELYNTTEYAISLEGIFLNDAPNEDNEVNRLDPISTTFKWIQPRGYVLIYAEDQSVNFSDSRLAEYFGLETESDQFTMQIDRSSLSLSATEDAIFISDSSGTTIDSVFYDESWQNPNRVSTDGVALEKINSDGPSNDESNWSSSTNVSGGSPGFQNSIYQEAGTTPSNSGISLTPNPFSPDDDGFEDFLTINYALDEADHLLRVRIYDRYGREVRELVDGKPAGFSGSLIWDGLTNEGNRNRVGIYIMLFQAYNSASGKDLTFKETVVIARKF